MSTSVLDGRVPFVMRTKTGEATGKVAGIPSSTPGLLVHWSSKRQTYAISTQSGLLVAVGWGRARNALQAAADLAGPIDWEAATADSVTDVPYSTILKIGKTIKRHEGQFLTSVPGTKQEHDLDKYYWELWRADSEIEDLQDRVEALEAELKSVRAAAKAGESRA